MIRSVTTAALLLAPAVRASDRTDADELKAAGHAVRLDKGDNLIGLTHVGPQFSMRLGDAGLATLATIPTLEDVTYDETILTDDGSLKHLTGRKGLKELKRNKTEVPTADLERLKADLPGVKIDPSVPEAQALEQMRKTLEKK